ncbi:MAG TPA: hypothetical protein VHN15_12615 [Thermoanaerobaculia bacterium]|nr:hypothetical protein [Thermoanaerobaculia bacterium]
MSPAIQPTTPPRSLLGLEEDVASMVVPTTTLEAGSALGENSNRVFMLVRDVLRAKAVEVDQGRVFEAFLRNASDALRAVSHGVVLGPSGRVSAEQLLDNIDHLMLLEAASLRPEDQPRAGRRRGLLTRALAEWALFQTLVVRNLLPEREANELVSYVRAIQKSGAS